MTRILLVRHGQASWGADDYDQLSELGTEQSHVLGKALSARGIRPDVLVSGAMKRHSQTAVAACEGAGWELPVTFDEGWNEFDHLQVLSLHPPPAEVDVMAEPRLFQAWFEAATQSWTAGEREADYAESFATFRARVDAGLARTAALVPASGTAVVFTSGGPIAAAATSRLAGDATVWRRLNQVSVNTGVTTLVSGSRGITLVTLNEHVHLAPDAITYR